MAKRSQPTAVVKKNPPTDGIIYPTVEFFEEGMLLEVTATGAKLITIAHTRMIDDATIGFAIQIWPGKPNQQAQLRLAVTLPETITVVEVARLGQPGAALRWVRPRP